MKLKFLLLMVLTAVLLQGCIVKSLHPFFKEDDVVFKNDLINTWTDGDGSRWTIRRHPLIHNAYEMHWLHNGEKDVVFLAHLFELGGEMYLDFLPMGSDKDDNLAIYNLHLMPTHSVAKVVVLNNDEVQIKWFSEEWLRKLFEQNRIRIAHETILDENPSDENDTWYVLTASTEALQKFLLKYGREGAEFSDENTVWLRLKKAV